MPPPGKNENKTTICKYSGFSIKLTVTFKFLLQFADLVAFYPVSR